MGTERITAGKYKKATAPLDETARERLCSLCSKAAATPQGEETSSELADLINSFYEGDGEWGIGFGSCRRKCFGEGLHAAAILSGAAADPTAQRIRVEVEDALRDGGSAGEEMKRRVVGLLRSKGYDAGLCKSQRDQSTTRRLPSGSHQYIDVLASSDVDGENRYIVEINLAAEFEIARPTGKYLALLRAIPKVFVGKPESLQRLIATMCVAAKDSIKSAGMHVPPWRTADYMQEKWLGPCTRTTATTSDPPSEHQRGTAQSAAGKKFCRMEIASSWEGRRTSGELQAFAFKGR